MATSDKQKVEEVRNLLDRDSVGRHVGDLWDTWKSSRSEWEDEKHELREYLFATDTTKTSNSSLPWNNKTTVPKLTQIRDNLHANYVANLFPRRKWFKWQAQSDEDDGGEKRAAIEAYMQTKIEDSGFRETMSELVQDFIDYGNAFAEVIFERNVTTLNSGIEVPNYIGPKLVRISPMDVVFDVTASRFEDTPHIVRTLKTLGQLHKELENQATSEQERQEAEAIIDYIERTRSQLATHTDAHIEKGADFRVDGFSTISDYYRSGFVEVLTFEGDLFDAERGEFHKNKRITVVDRSKVVWMGDIESWLGKTNKQHVGWRTRPDNLMAMGPLDNLVGMQYRIDHLENVKADLFDLIAYPPVMIKGEVDAFEWGPLQQIFADDDASIELLSPETQALNADTFIARYEAQMEEFAGAPREAMGIRTPGEKTAFEVAQLQNASSRIFQNKTKHFEVVFVEPLLNKMLEAGRRNVEDGESVREFDETFGIEDFLSITADDITAAGKLKPIGARHFAESAQIAQSIVQLYQSGLMTDPAVSVHLSGKKLSQLLEEVLQLDTFDIYAPNIRVSENVETQSLAQTGAAQLQDEELADATMVRGESGEEAVQGEEGGGDANG